MQLKRLVMRVRRASDRPQDGSDEVPRTAVVDRLRTAHAGCGLCGVQHLYAAAALSQTHLLTNCVCVSSSLAVLSVRARHESMVLGQQRVSNSREHALSCDLLKLSNAG
jgi:hypothetical protein